MSKINYSQAEEGMNEAIRKMRMKKLQEGKPVTSDRAVEFYNLSLEERSLPQDPVEQLLESESGPQQDVEGEYEEAGQVVDSVKQEESIAKIRPAKTKAPSAVPYSKDIDAKSIAQPEAVSPLLILRKHIFWLKTKNMEERYALIGTSKPEIFALRKKKRTLPKGPAENCGAEFQR